MFTGLVRSRSGLAGVAVAVVLGGGLVSVSAAGSSTGSVMVPIVPCRLLDTRPDTNVGPRATPLSGGETYTVPATGRNGQCDLPADAIGLSINATIVNPSAPSFLTIWPAGRSRPNASSLNWVGGQAPTPNAVTSALSDTGEISVFNFDGQVDLVVDINGYYVETSAGGVGPAGPAGPTGPAGAAGPAGATGATGPSGPAGAIGPAGASGAPGASGATGPAGAQGVAGEEGATGATGRTGSVPRLSKTQIAMLRWDLDPGLPGTFAALPYLRGIASDGTNIWVAAANSQKVSRITPASGTSVDFDAGNSPTNIAFDGTNLWVTNLVDDTVSKINPSTGLVIDGYQVGHLPEGVVFDGTSIWITNTGDDTVSKISIVTGVVVPYSVVAPSMLAFDGTHLWITSRGYDTLMKFNPASGQVVGVYETGDQPRGVAFDGTHLWVANEGDGTVSKIDRATGAEVAYPTGERPRGVAFDGTNIWVTNYNQYNVPGEDTVAKVDRDTGTVVTYPVAVHPEGIAFDGTNIWVSHYTSPGVVTKLLP